MLPGLLLVSCQEDSLKRLDGTVVVSVAMSLSEAMERIVFEYEQETQGRIILNTGGSDTLATQIINGAPVDLFISADQHQMDRLQEQSMIRLDSRRDLLSNELVFIAKEDTHFSGNHFSELIKPEIRRIAIGDPDAVPVGVYAKEYLVDLGLWNQVRDRVVPTRNVQAVVSTVAAGHAEVGVVYRTDAMRSPNIRIVGSVPRSEGPVIRYSVAIISGSTDQFFTEKFLDYLLQEQALDIFQSAGFIIWNSTS
tara:strand:- start:457 stop:1212 length:756 start_codon:yes stop_codon:yes gene_type:complete